MRTLEQLDSFLCNIAELYARVLKRRRDFWSYKCEQVNALRALSPDVILTANDIETVPAWWGKSVLSKIKRLAVTLSDAEKRLCEIQSYLNGEADAGNDIEEANALLSKSTATLLEFKERLALLGGNGGEFLTQRAKELRRELKRDLQLAREYLRNDAEKFFKDYGGQYCDNSEVWCGDPSLPNDLTAALVRLGIDEVDNYKSKYPLTTPSQKPLSNLKGDEVNETGSFPTCICLGRNRITITGAPFFEKHDNVCLETPRMVKFPFSKPLVYKNETDLSILLLRLVFAIPNGRLRIAVVDSNPNGGCWKCIQRLNGLGKIKNLVTLCNTSDECAALLGSMDEYIGNVMKQSILQGENWSDNNPYHVVVIDSLAGISPDKFLSLKKMLTSGTKAGVLTLIAEQAVAECGKIGNNESVAREISRLDFPALKALLEDPNEQ